MFPTMQMRFSLNFADKLFVQVLSSSRTCPARTCLRFDCGAWRSGLASQSSGFRQRGAMTVKPGRLHWWPRISEVIHSLGLLNLELTTLKHEKQAWELSQSNAASELIEVCSVVQVTMVPTWNILQCNWEEHTALLREKASDKQTIISCNEQIKLLQATAARSQGLIE